MAELDEEMFGRLEQYLTLWRHDYKAGHVWTESSVEGEGGECNIIQVNVMIIENMKQIKP